jgi:glucose/arabinose dehydrogenase
MQRLARTGAALAAVLVLAGCAAAATVADPNWKPQPSFAGEGHLPNIELPLPTPSGPPDSGASTGPGLGSPSPTGSSADDPAVVARRLTAPTALALLPDGTALVGERTTGRIVRVRPQPNLPVSTVRTIRGLSTTGGGGLLDLALSPHYSQDSLIFAYLTTPTDNRVVAFTLTGPITPVLAGIPRGPSDNAGRLVFGADSYLYVGTGDAGRAALASDPTSLAGKVLRITDIGRPAPGNPSANSPVFTSGHHVINGLCTDGTSMLALEAGTGRVPDEVNQLVPGGSYGWPSGSGTAPIATLPATQRGPGDCAISAGVLYVSSLTGRGLLSGTLTTNRTTLAVGRFTLALANKYGRLLTVVAAPDGALWLTTANRDGSGSPIPDDERVLRIVPSGGGGGGGAV